MNLLATLLGNDNPPLPSLLAMQTGLRLGWALVLAWFALWCAMRLTQKRQPTAMHAVLLAAIAVWTCLPGKWSPAFWLGLAFNAPSLLSVLLCGWLLLLQWLPPRTGVGPAGGSGNPVPWRHVATAWQVGGFLLGLLLFLDWLAFLPWQLYAWGFGPLPWGLVLSVSLIPCIVFNPLRRETGWMLLPPLACIVFSLTRLPTGNVWDALLDPLLWLVLCSRVSSWIRRKNHV